MLRGLQGGSHGYFFGYCHVLHVLDVDFPDKALEVILDYFMDMEIREEFYSFFNQLSDIYEIILLMIFSGIISII